MTGDQRSEGDADTRPGQPRQPTKLSVAAVLQTAIGRIRRDPLLAVPFTIAGILVALVDWLRTRDPIPVATPDALSQTVSLQYSVVPQGTARTVRYADAMIDLQLPYLLWAGGLELVVVLVVGFAGWLTIARTLETSFEPGGLSRYLLALMALVSLPQLLGASITIERFLVGLGLLAVFLAVAVRLFLFPACLVAGSGFITSLRQSYRRSSGHGTTIAGIVIVIGLASWGLVKIPHLGGFLSTAIVAPVHAVVLGTIVAREPTRLDAGPIDHSGEQNISSDPSR